MTRSDVTNYFYLKGYDACIEDILYAIRQVRKKRKQLEKAND
jgi:hypothetical protein